MWKILLSEGFRNTRLKSLKSLERGMKIEVNVVYIITHIHTHDGSRNVD